MSAIKTFLFFTFIFNYTVVFSNEKSEWNKGMVTLNSNEVVWGDINYNPRYDIVQCKTSEGVKTFSTFHVRSFRYYDPSLEVNRFYITCEDGSRNFKRKSFYEVVLHGELEMYRKEKLFASSRFNSDFQFYVPHVADYDYFIMANEKLIHVKNFKKKILKEAMKDQYEEVVNYMKLEKLSTYPLRDQILTVDFYNSLKDPNYTPLVVLSNERVFVP